VLRTPKKGAENSMLDIAGAAFHPEPICTGWGPPKGGPFNLRARGLLGKRPSTAAAS
jgi:hypothetical protein